MCGLSKPLDYVFGTGFIIVKGGDMILTSPSPVNDFNAVVFLCPLQ